MPISMTLEGFLPGKFVNPITFSPCNKGKVVYYIRIRIIYLNQMLVLIFTILEDFPPGKHFELICLGAK